MNYFLLVAGFLSAFFVLVHFILGSKWYLKPMLDSDLEEVPKATMQSLFHYVSAFLLLSAIILLLLGFGFSFDSDPRLLIFFIGDNFIFFACIEIYYSFRNKIEKPLITMFQWVMFIPIGILCFLGA